LLTVFGFDGAARLTFAQESAIAAAGHATAITHTAVPTNFFGPLIEDLLSSDLSAPRRQRIAAKQAEGIITSTPEFIENLEHLLLLEHRGAPRTRPASRPARDFPAGLNGAVSREPDRDAETSAKERTQHSGQRLAECWADRFRALNASRSKAEVGVPHEESH
jgi:hypothetical protein